MAAEEGMPTGDEARALDQGLRGDAALAAEASGATPHEGRRPSRRKGGMFEWLTRSAELREARAALHGDGSRASELGRRARLACELADRAFDPIEPLRDGSGAPLAADLYRQATCWALCGLHPEIAASAPAELWAAATDQVSWAIPNAAQRERLRALFVDTSFVALGEMPREEQAELASAARTLAHASLEALEGPRRTVERLQFRRLVRVGSFVLLLAGASVASTLIYDRATRGPDLAAGKPWVASSVWAPCEPAARRCGALRTDIFFHTTEDSTPWIEFDLLAPVRFSSVYVRNRTDAVPDRAVPLMVEVSNDKKTWREVARRKESFRNWTARFAPQTARYLRLRVARRSWLHLEKVEVYQ